MAAEIVGLPWLAAGVAAAVLAGGGSLALARRSRRSRLGLAAGLVLLGACVMGALGLALKHPDSPMGLPAMLLTAAAFLLPVPLLYALTFPGEPR